MTHELYLCDVNLNSKRKVNCKIKAKLISNYYCLRARERTPGKTHMFKKRICLKKEYICGEKIYNDKWKANCKIKAKLI